MFYIVHPYVAGPKRMQLATIVAEHATAEGAFLERDLIAQRLYRNGLAGDVIELLVVDETRQLVPRPGAH
jgi:hypothetical protein